MTKSEVLDLATVRQLAMRDAAIRAEIVEEIALAFEARAGKRQAWMDGEGAELLCDDERELVLSELSGLRRAAMSIRRHAQGAVIHD